MTDTSFNFHFKLICFAFIKILVIFSVSTVFLIKNADATTVTFRCKNDLVNLGDSISSALQKCGEPLHKYSFCEPIAVPLAQPYPHYQTPLSSSNHSSISSYRHYYPAPPLPVAACANVDEWTYNPRQTHLNFIINCIIEKIYKNKNKKLRI